MKSNGYLIINNDLDHMLSQMIYMLPQTEPKQDESHGTTETPLYASNTRMS